MIACPTPRNSQVTARKAEAIPSSHQIWIVFLTVLHSEVWLTSASLPLHFGLSLCNPLEQVSPLYALWKGTYMAFKWGIKAWSVTRGCIAIKLVKDLSSFASYYARTPLAMSSGLTALSRSLISNLFEIPVVIARWIEEMILFTHSLFTTP